MNQISLSHTNYTKRLEDSYKAIKMGKWTQVMYQIVAAILYISIIGFPIAVLFSMAAYLDELVVLKHEELELLRNGQIKKR